MKKLSIIILNYNTRDLLVDCLKSLEKVKDELEFEVIVVDNNSSDDSVSAAKKFDTKIIKSKKNLGFARGNNLARNVAKGKYILFLNSDTIVHKDALKESYNYMQENSDVGAMTVKLLLPNGKLDKDTRRSFPTPYVAITHFLYLDRIFSSSKLFGRYWYGYRSEDSVHEVDVLQGAYFFTRRDVLDEVDWFDEDYFMDGEDIDLCWKINNAGYKLVYFPKVSITHIKKGSKKKDQRKSRQSVTKGVDAMKIFYKKRLSSNYPFYINRLVYFGISIIKGIRSIKLLLK